MNIGTGEMFNLPQSKVVPRGSVALRKEEVSELKKFRGQERLRRYKQMHADDDCRSCGKKLRYHPLREFQTCYSK